MKNMSQSNVSKKFLNVLNHYSLFPNQIFADI